MDNRWYDNHNATLQTFELLKNLDETSRERLSNDIIEIAKQIKTMHKEEDEPVLSIGLPRVLGLYKSFEGRRWYDQNEELSAAIKTISTLPEDDFLNIMEGLSVSLSD